MIPISDRYALYPVSENPQATIKRHKGFENDYRADITILLMKSLSGILTLT